jgi:membrane-bound lytic murein transglycosylase D
VPDATTLDVVARAAEVTEEEIFRLNPAFVRGMTPPGRPVAIRVPAGQGATFELNYALVPPGERVSLVEHVVSDGETLSHIAVRYGISVSDLQAANPDVRPRRMRVGMRLTVPVGRRASGSGQ